MSTDTTRRSLLIAAPVVALTVAIPAAGKRSDDMNMMSRIQASADDHYTREEHEAGRKSAEEIAYLSVARAWIDRRRQATGDAAKALDSLLVLTPGVAQAVREIDASAAFGRLEREREG